MNEVDNATLAVIFILVLIILLPIGWIMVISTPEPYHVVPGEPVREAVVNSGIKVISAVDYQLPIPGSTGGKIYTISDENGNIFTIQTQSFDSAETRDAAIQLHNAQSAGRGKPVEDVVLVGNHLIYVKPYMSEIVKKILPELQKKRAV
jgi:hypothetical protein